MSNPGTNYWKSLGELADWLDRNCLSCRYYKSEYPGLEPPQCCPVPKLALKLQLQNSAPPTLLIGIMYHHASHSDIVDPFRAPYRCGSRVDIRGRPRKQVS